MAESGYDYCFSRQLLTAYITINHIVIAAVCGTSGGCLVLLDRIGRFVAESWNFFCYSFTTIAHLRCKTSLCASGVLAFRYNEVVLMNLQNRNFNCCLITNFLTVFLCSGREGDNLIFTGTTNYVGVFHLYFVRKEKYHTVTKGSNYNIIICFFNSNRRLFCFFYSCCISESNNHFSNLGVTANSKCNCI